MKHKHLYVFTIIVSCLFYNTLYSIEASDIIIIDRTEDVRSHDFFTGETKVVTAHPDIEVDNLDLIYATYQQQGIQVTLSLQVVGNIENREKTRENFSEYINYGFKLYTSEHYYGIYYFNHTCKLIRDSETINLTSSDFSVVGDTFSVTFTLFRIDEIYENLEIISYYVKANFSDENLSIIQLADVAPPLPLSINDIYAPDLSFVGINNDFYATINWYTGQPPYTYYWDFGDGGSSTQLKTTHNYTSAGIYTYTFTVTDNAGDTASESDTITIKETTKAFLFGTFTRMYDTEEGSIIEAVNIRMIILKPFQSVHYVSGQKILCTNQYKFILFPNRNFLIGMFNIVIDSTSRSQICYPGETSMRNTATEISQRFLPENILNVVD